MDNEIGFASVDWQIFAQHAGIDVDGLNQDEARRRCIAWLLVQPKDDLKITKLCEDAANAATTFLVNMSPNGDDPSEEN